MRHTLPVLITIALAASAFAATTPRTPATLDDGPGAGGGYGKQAHTLDDGPGAGGGYGKQVHTLDDGPGAGGGYGKQVHTLDDGPGAGGGYDAQGQLFFVPPSWRSI